MFCQLFPGLRFHWPRFEIKHGRTRTYTPTDKTFWQTHIYTYGLHTVIHLTHIQCLCGRPNHISVLRSSVSVENLVVNCCYITGLTVLGCFFLLTFSWYVAPWHCQQVNGKNPVLVTVRSSLSISELVLYKRISGKVVWKIPKSDHFVDLENLWFYIVVVIMSAVHAEGLCSSTSEIIFTSIFSRKSLWLKAYDKHVNVFLLLLFLFYNQYKV